MTTINETAICVIESCGKPIHPERLAFKPGSIITCSHACAVENKRNISRRAFRKYIKNKRRTDPDWVARQAQYQRDYRARKKAETS